MVFKEREYFGEPADMERKKSAQLEFNVAAALAASGKVDATEVEVTIVAGSTVVLTGWVANEEEIRGCIEIASSVEGIQHVQNKTSVRNSGTPVNNGA